MVDAELRVTIEFAPDSKSWPTVRVSGEVDIQTSPILERHLTKVLEDGHSSIFVDFGEVTFLDSTGLSVLVTALKRSQSTGGQVRLVAPQPNVRRVLEITGLTEAFQIGGGVESAPD